MSKAPGTLPSGYSESAQSVAAQSADPAAAQQYADDAEDMSREQEYVTVLYGHLDSLRERATARLAGKRSWTSGPAGPRGWTCT